MEAGATSLFEPADMFYGDRCGGVDPCGNQWYVATRRRIFPRRRGSGGEGGRGGISMSDSAPQVPVHAIHVVVFGLQQEGWWRIGADADVRAQA
jgi:hypothetical protein